MFKKLPGDFRLPRLDAESKAHQQNVLDKASYLSEKTAQMKESVILRAANMTASEARGQVHRFQRTVTADLVEHVFLDGKPLVDFLPGRIEDGHWKMQYRLCHEGNKP